MEKKFNPKRKPDKLPYRKIGECYLLYNNKLIAKDAGHYLAIPGGGIEKEKHQKKVVKEN